LNVAIEQVVNGDRLLLEEISEGNFSLPDGTSQIGVIGVFRHGETALRLGEGSVIALEQSIWEVVSIDTAGQSTVLRRVG